MPQLARPDGTIHYEVFGDRFPVLLFAPGGARGADHGRATGEDRAPGQAELSGRGRRGAHAGSPAEGLSWVASPARTAVSSVLPPST